MHQCLSCNQPCSLLSAFCDACRASLLARRDQVIPEEQKDRIRAGGGSEGGYVDWEVSDGMSDLAAFPQPEAPQVGALPSPVHAQPPASMEEQGAWSFETSDIYAMETAGEFAGAGAGAAVAVEVRGADAAQSTHMLPVPPRPWQRMPKKVRRALLIFCVVGTVALLTDGILLALSLTRHHVAANNVPVEPTPAISQHLAPPVPNATLTPTQTVSSTFVLSPQRLTFSANVGQSSLAPQSVTFAGLSQGTTWRIESASGMPGWLRLSTVQGNGTASSTVSVTVGVRPAGLTAGVYTASLQVRAFDAQGKPLPGSPGTLGVTLNVHPPCTLSINPTKLSFGSVLGSVPAPQTLTLSASSTCALPLSWQASSDVSWLTFSRAAGMLSGSSTLVVQASTSGKLIGSYTAHITLRGTDGSGLAYVVTPTTVSVTLTVLA